MKLQQNISDTVQTGINNSDTIVVFDTLIAQDSVQPDTIPNKQITSIFQHSDNINRSISEEPRTRIDFDWITIHLLIVLALIAWARVYYQKRFGQLFMAFYGQRYQGILLKEGNVFRERISIPLLINYLVTYSIFIYLLLNRFITFQNYGYTGFKLFALIILIILLLWIVKNAITLITGYLFKNPVILNDYIVTQFIFNINLGFYLLPFVILASYTWPVISLKAGILLWLIVFIYRVIRQFLTELNYTEFSLLNRILYLCTFEIAPILVVIKLILNNLK